MQKTITVAVINDKKKLLILRRGSTAPWMPNRYCLPGGHIEDGESFEEGGKRELFEETGINCCLTDLDRVVFYFSREYSKTILILNSASPSVNLNWEHDHYDWIDSKNIHKYNLVPSLGTLVNFLSRREFID